MFTESVEKLKEAGYDTGKILDFYIEALKSGKTHKMTDFTHLLDGTDDYSHIRLLDTTKIYKEVAKAWRKIDPPDFLQQYDSYVENRRNDTGLENGIIYEKFFKHSMSDENILIINPHPSFMKKCMARKSKTNFAFSFTDVRYCEVLQYSEIKINCTTLKNLSDKKFSRVLYFARDVTREEIQDTLNEVNPALIPEKKTSIYIMLPTAYIENRKTKGEFWEYLIKNYTVYRTILFCGNTVMNKPNKKCLLMLQNVPMRKNDEVLIQKTKLAGKDILTAMEFRRVAYKSFANNNRTLSELYNTDYIDYSQPKTRSRPEAYSFTLEFPIYISVTKNEKRGYRPNYGFYHYPTTDQKRKNVIPRGKRIGQLHGKWYQTRADAISSAENILLNDEKLARIVSEIITNEYYMKPVSLKTQIFIHLDDLKKQKNYDEDFIKSVFFQPNSYNTKLCSVPIGTATLEDIQNAVDAYLSEQRLSEAKENLLWDILEFALDFAVVDDRYKKNPIRSLMQHHNESNKIKKDVRKALVNISFSTKQEREFIQIVLSEKNSPITMMMLVKYFSGQALNVLRALSNSDIVYNPDLKMYQFTITKTLRSRDPEVHKLPLEAQRYIPIPAFVMEAIISYRKERHLHPKQPLFASLSDPNKPISERQFWNKFNEIMDKLNIPEFKISIADGDNSPKQTDIDNYGGDFLRSNFVYHAKYDALLEPDEIKIMLGTKPDTTEAQYYCDYKNQFIQLGLRTKLDRWLAKVIPLAEKEYTVEEITNEIIIRGAPSRDLSELLIEIDLDDIDTSILGLNELIISAYAEYGAFISVDFWEDE